MMRFGHAVNSDDVESQPTLARRADGYRSMP